MPEATEENDVVDMDLFWERMELSQIARGILKGKLITNKF